MITVASASGAGVEFTGRGETMVSIPLGSLSLTARAGAGAPAPTGAPTAREAGTIVTAASAEGGRDAGIMVAAESACKSTPQRAQRLAPGALENLHPGQIIRFLNYVAIRCVPATSNDRPNKLMSFQPVQLRADDLRLHDPGALAPGLDGACGGAHPHCSGATMGENCAGCSAPGCLWIGHGRGFQ
jgi:hypothetical protein